MTQVWLMESNVATEVLYEGTDIYDCIHWLTNGMERFQLEGGSKQNDVIYVSHA